MSKEREKESGGRKGKKSGIARPSPFALTKAKLESGKSKAKNGMRRRAEEEGGKRKQKVSTSNFCCRERI